MLDPRDASNLQTMGLLRPGPGNGTWLIHRRHLTPSNTPNNRHAHIPLDSRSENAFATIPQSLISRATLTYIGLVDPKADEVWADWTSLPTTAGPSSSSSRGKARQKKKADNKSSSYSSSSFPSSSPSFPSPKEHREEHEPTEPTRFITWVVERVTRTDRTAARLDTWNKTDDSTWHVCLEGCGVDAMLKAEIMRPGQFAAARRVGGSCLYWVRVMMEARYYRELVEQVRVASRERGERVRRDWPGCVFYRRSGGGRRVPFC